MLGKLQ